MCSGEVCIHLINTILIFFSNRIKHIENTSERDEVIKNMLRRKYNDLGPMSFHEKVVLVLFNFLVLLWFFRSPGFVTGWGDVLSYVFPNV